MGQEIKGIFRWRPLVIWIAVVVFFIGFMPQLKADVENAEGKGDGWVQTNGPYGGEILALYAAPKGVLFVGTEGGGIFRSTDRGDTWTPVNTGLHFELGEGFTGVTAFAQKGDTFYAGTRRTLYASTDGGTTWHHVSTFREYESISGIVVIEDRIYVGTLNTGVWYSDDGDAWIQVDDGFPRSIYLLSKIGTTLVASTPSGVFRKRDNEDSWTPINTRFDDLSGGGRVHSFAAIGNLMYVGGHRGFRGGYSDEARDGIFRFDTEGDTWTHITAKEMTNTVEALSVYGGTLYASSGRAVYRSDDKGDSWTIVNDGLTHGTVSTLLAVNEDTVFVGTSGDGVFRTMDGGHSWVEINTGITNATVSELEVAGDKVYTRVGGKIVYSADGGKSWQPVNIPSTAMKYGFPSLSVSDGELYVGAVSYATRHGGVDLGGIFRLDAENNTLVELIVDGNLAGLECIEVVGTTFYMGTLYNGVIQWKKGSDPWPMNLGLEHHYIAMLSGNGERVYAGTADDEIYRLKEGTWEPIHATDMMDGGMSDLRWAGSTLYATFLNGGVFRSVNGGDSWMSINDGLDEASAVSIGIDGTELYIGTFTGVFRWISAKERWEPVGSLPHQILSLAVLDGFLYAGTAYNGVFKIRIEK